MAAPQPESKIIELKPFTDEMIVSMGPQHPSTHGVLRLELKLDGEVVRGRNSPYRLPAPLL